MKRIVVGVKNVSPLLMHSFPMVPIEAIEKKSKEEQAELSTYRTPDNKLYIPAINIQRSLIAAAAFSKGKGRASLTKTAAACFDIYPEYIILDPQEYVVDSRPVVVPATRGRILRHRPRFDEWKIEFELEFNENLITEKQARRIMDD